MCTDSELHNTRTYFQKKNVKILCITDDLLEIIIIWYHFIGILYMI